MKKIFSKAFATIIFSAVLFQMPLFAQVKTNFTPEVRRSGANPTGLAPAEHSMERNAVDVKMPKKTRGVIDRYKKLNIWGKDIPDSFLFYRNTLNKNQKDVYDVAYKALMKNEKGADLPVGLTEDEFFDTMYAVEYDNPESFWWAGNYTYRVNSDDIVTSFTFKNWLDSSELEKKYEDFWNATAPIIFYASKLPDEMSKIKYVHDYICLSTEYDDDAAESGNTGGKYQTAYSSAVEYKTVCAGYSALFQYYMQNLGIPCTYISSGSHAWNFLKVNGQCYQMDVTWNDTAKIPPYFNLTHEEMGKIKSHTPKALSKKVIDANPSKGKEMSYLEYFGALYEGSPYTYEELNYYDYEKNTSTQDFVKIYKSEPVILNIVRSADELKSVISKLNYSDGTVFSFFIPTEKELDEIRQGLKKGDICDWSEGQFSHTGSSIIYDLTLTGSNKIVETSSSVYSLYVTLGGGSADNAKKVAEAFSNVTSVTVNNLEKDRFELTLSISGDSEIRPTLVKKLVEGGFDLYEMSITQSKDDVSTKNTEASKNPEPRKKTEPTKKVDSTAAKDTVKKSAPKIGDKGPAGGIVFYIEGKKAYECSEPLGNVEWEEAITLCKKYRGGEKSDWYLPTKEELNYIYKNLREPEIINDDERLWSSLEDDDKTLAWAQGFSTKGRYPEKGEQFTNYKWIPNIVRAVRAFEF